MKHNNFFLCILSWFQLSILKIFKFPVFSQNFEIPRVFPVWNYFSPFSLFFLGLRTLKHVSHDPTFPLCLQILSEHPISQKVFPWKFIVEYIHLKIVSLMAKFFVESKKVTKNIINSNMAVRIALKNSREAWHFEFRFFKIIFL